jgi:hypothetical protein
VTPTSLQYLQIAVGIGLLVYAVVLVAQRVRDAGLSLPRLPWHQDHSVWMTPPAPDEPDDLQVLIGMAARFRDVGNQEAVRACQALIDQLLNPKPKPVPTP